MAGFDGKRGAVTGVHFFADAAGCKAGDVLGLIAGEAENRADAVGGVVHGREARPISGPAFHILLVGSFEELEFAEFAFVVEFLHEEKLAGVDDGLHHHVFESGGLGNFNDSATVIDRGRHRDSAGDVFSGF